MGWQALRKAEEKRNKRMTAKMIKAKAMKYSMMEPWVQDSLRYAEKLEKEADYL